jgi:phage baseplate assembly protein W
MLRTELAHDRLSDLMLRPTRRADSALHLDRRATVAGFDLDLVTDQDAVGQAVWLALAIPRGDLTQLGHPNFGSRLHLLIGELLTETTIARAHAYIREALRGDPRFKVRDVTLTRNAADPGAVEAEITVDPEATLVFDLQSLISGEGLVP